MSLLIAILSFIVKYLAVVWETKSSKLEIKSDADISHHQFINILFQVGMGILVIDLHSEEWVFFEK